MASGTINYALGTVATPGKAMGTFGQARAYAKGSLTDFPAYGDGRVSLPKVDNPGLSNAQKKVDKAETARNATKKTRAKASKHGISSRCGNRTG